jgi:stage IV sporulation protein FB
MKLSTNIGNTKFTFDLLLFILLFFIPAKIVLFLVVSVILHELGHYIAANIFKYNVVEFRISLFTSFVQFEQKITKPIHSLIISLAGPFMNLLLMIYSSYMNMIDLFSINFVLYIINLLPIETTDGNEALKSILDIFKINNSQKISNIIGIILSILLIVFLLTISEFILALCVIILLILLNITS